MDSLYCILQCLSPHSVAWYAIAAARQETLEQYFDLSPTERRAYHIEPNSVICVL